MTQPLVEQLRFARKEFQRGIDGVDEEAAQRRFLPMNCISWNVGHLAWHEQREWLINQQGIVLLPDVEQQFASGAPASTPPLADSWAAWAAITAAADPWLDALTAETIMAPAHRDGKPTRFTVGSRMLRMIYHYWYHTGENAGIRQNLGHADLPQFVGAIEREAPYRLG
jgi:hypothetical protein